MSGPRARSTRADRSVASGQAARFGPEAGLSLIELLIAMIAGLLVLMVVYSALISQSREYQKHREDLDVAETLRGATVLLTSELQHASSSRNDLYAIGAQSITLRSYQQAGAVCGTSTNRYGIWLPSGTFVASSSDSAMAYKLSSGGWGKVQVNAVWSNPGSPVAACTWAAGGTPTKVIELLGDTAGVGVGSPIRGFYKAQYAMVQSEGRWWLGRRKGSAVDYDLVTGPLKSPSDSGLAFHYYTSAGATTTDPLLVARVEIVLRAESFRVVRIKRDSMATRSDSVTAVAYLRN